MPAKPKKNRPPATLRSRAETQLGKHMARADESDAQRAVHELEVHQIELEMQNADLRAAREEAEALIGQYTELKEEVARRKRSENELKAQRKELSRILRQSRLQQKQLRHFSHRILHAQEEERKRISRELHDVIAQALVSINMHLEVLAEGPNQIPRSLRRQISQTQQLVEKALKIVHDFARQLRPTMLDDLGLIPALQMFVKEFTVHSGIRVSLDAAAEVDQSSTAVRTVLYRIAQEALTNVARHANASDVKIHLVKLGDVICMSLTDNGGGFDLTSKTFIRKQARLGLIGMQERAEMIGGTFELTSSVGGPTTVRIEIPVAKP